MAPFKLKFRMGSGSRSTSQEIEEPVQQPLLTRQSSICDSSTTIDSEFTSMSSTNDQHNLLPNKFDEETGKWLNPCAGQCDDNLNGSFVHVGYENPAIMRTITDSRCYQNASHSTNVEKVSPMWLLTNVIFNKETASRFQEHEQCDHQCGGETHTHSSANDGASPGGTQTFAADSAQSNENLLDSTVGSTDPLFAGQSLKDINLGCAQKFQPKTIL